MSAPRAKRQKRIVGGIYKVPLAQGEFAYGQALEEADFAFFDQRDQGDSRAADLAGKPVLFRVAVHKSAWIEGRWPLIGPAPMTGELAQPAPKFMQDALNPDKFSIYCAGRIRPASREECAGLERSAVWDPEHVEERLRDHYAGRPNKWTNSLRMK